MYKVPISVTTFVLAPALSPNMSFTKKNIILFALYNTSSSKTLPFVQSPTRPADIAPCAHTPIPSGDQQRPAPSAVQGFRQEVHPSPGQLGRDVAVWEHLVRPRGVLRRHRCGLSPARGAQTLRCGTNDCTRVTSPETLELIASEGTSSEVVVVVGNTLV